MMCMRAVAASDAAGTRGANAPGHEKCGGKSSYAYTRRPLMAKEQV